MQKCVQADDEWDKHPWHDEYPPYEEAAHHARVSLLRLQSELLYHRRMVSSMVTMWPVLEGGRQGVMQHPDMRDHERIGATHRELDGRLYGWSGMSRGLPLSTMDRILRDLDDWHYRMLEWVAGQLGYFGHDTPGYPTPPATP